MALPKCKVCSAEGCLMHPQPGRVEMADEAAERVEVRQQLSQLRDVHALCGHVEAHLQGEVASLQARLRAVEAERDQLVFRDQSGHSEKMSLSGWMDYWRKERDAAQAEARRLREALTRLANDAGHRPDYVRAALAFPRGQQEKFCISDMAPDWCREPSCPVHGLESQPRLTPAWPRIRARWTCR